MQVVATVGLGVSGPLMALSDLLVELRCSIARGRGLGAVLGLINICGRWGLFVTFGSRLFGGGHSFLRPRGLFVLCQLPSSTG
jgi:hypothetical protein